MAGGKDDLLLHRRQSPQSRPDKVEVKPGESFKVSLDWQTKHLPNRLLSGGDDRHQRPEASGHSRSPSRARYSSAGGDLSSGYYHAQRDL